MGKTGVYIPRAGSQYVGMGKEFFTSDPDARSLFTRADEILGVSISRIVLEGPDEALKQTSNTQPANFFSTVLLFSIRWRRGCRIWLQDIPRRVHCSCRGRRSLV